MRTQGHPANGQQRSSGTEMFGKDDREDIMTDVVFCCAGLNGAPSACRHLRDLISRRQNVDVHILKCNWPYPFSYFRTRDGIDTGGKRLAREIQQIIDGYNTNSVASISMIGISLGGLYLRYAMGELYDPSTRSIASCTPKAYISIGSPHLGIPSHHLTTLQTWAVGQFLGQTGRQLLLENNLLRHMCQPNSVYMNALRAFTSRTAYAIRKEDSGSVPFMSAALLPEILDTTTTVFSTCGIDKEFPHIVAEHTFDGNFAHLCEFVETHIQQVEYDAFQDEKKSLQDCTIQMLRELRSMAWTHVEVHFDHFWGRLTSHNSMAVNSRLFHSHGQDVAQHIQRKLVTVLETSVKSQRSTLVRQKASRRV